MDQSFFSRGRLIKGKASCSNSCSKRFFAPTYYVGETIATPITQHSLKLKIKFLFFNINVTVESCCSYILTSTSTKKLLYEIFYFIPGYHKNEKQSLSCLIFYSLSIFLVAYDQATITKNIIFMLFFKKNPGRSISTAL
jgi:hypothetical protein